MNNDVKPNQLLTVRAAAKMLGMAEDTIYAWVAARRVPVVRLGRSIRFKRAEIERMIDDRTYRAKSEL